MPATPTVFAQITARIFPSEFARCVDVFQRPRSSRSFSAYDHFLAICFGQLTGRESLRDVVTCLTARPQLQYRLGFRGSITRTNLAYANEHRDWRVFAGVAELLMRKASRLYREELQTEGMRELVYALDSSIIELSLKLVPWAYYPRSKASALKLHLLLGLNGNLPLWAAITEALFPEQKVMDQVPVQPNAFYAMDRGYLDFTRPIRWHRAGAFFVVRNKCHVRLRVLASRPANKISGLRCDQTFRLCRTLSRKVYPAPLRRVRYRDPVEQRSFVFLTNHFELPPEQVAHLYRRRWQVELFFKRMKQHLRVRPFYGRSENTIRCQIWTAICSYLLVALAKKELRIELSLFEMLQILSVAAFEETLIEPLFSKTQDHLNHQQNQNIPCFQGFLTGH
ncbi:MAG: IS4 family transposase [Verrucomicrobia bacterium]|nr:IS4 family transposase [Verrucomicrobiota bacterium]